jgi:hypothetical protein
MIRSLKWDMCRIFGQPFKANNAIGMGWDAYSDLYEDDSVFEGSWSERKQRRLDKHVSPVLQYSCTFWDNTLERRDSEQDAES